MSRYSLRVFLIVALAVATSSLAVASSEREPEKAIVEECEKDFDKINSLQGLLSFLIKTHTIIEQQDSSKVEMSKCLRTDEEQVHKEIMGFMEIIKRAGRSTVCDREAADEMIRLEELLSLQKEPNKLLAIWWDKFIRQVVVNCKRGLADKLWRYSLDIDQNYHGVGYIRSMMTLARNINWLADGINESPFKAVKPNLRSLEGQNLVARIGLSVETTRRIEELDQLREHANELAPGDEVLELDFRINKRNSRLLQLSQGCRELLIFQRELIDPLLDLMRLGYYAEESSVSKNNNQLFDLWLAVEELCLIVGNVHILKLPETYEHMKLNQRSLRLKISPITNAKNLKNKLINEEIFESPKRSLYRRYFSPYERFSRFDDNLDDVKWRNSIESSPSKAVTRAKSILASRQFLQLIADYVKMGDIEDDIN